MGPCDIALPGLDDGLALTNLRKARRDRRFLLAPWRACGRLETWPAGITATAKKRERIAARPVAAVDATGAGDCFDGCRRICSARRPFRRRALGQCRGGLVDAGVRRRRPAAAPRRRRGGDGGGGRQTRSTSDEAAGWNVPGLLGRAERPRERAPRFLGQTTRHVRLSAASFTSTLSAPTSLPWIFCRLSRLARPSFAFARFEPRLCGRSGLTRAAIGPARTKPHRRTRAGMAIGSTPTCIARKATPATPPIGTAAPASRSPERRSTRNGRRSPARCSRVTAGGRPSSLSDMRFSQRATY